MKLIDLLNADTYDLDCAVVCGDVDCEADFVWEPGDKVTEAGIKAWKNVLECEAVYDEKNNVLIIDCDPDEGNNFFLSAAGYCSEKSFDAWFTDGFKEALNRFYTEKDEKSA